MAGAADRSGVGCGMHVRGVGAHGDVDRHRRSLPVSLEQKTRPAVLWGRPGFEPTSQRFAHAQSVAMARGNGAVHVAARFFGGAKAAVRQYRFDIFTGVSGECDFEIVDGRRAIERERGDVSAAHEVHQHRREAAFNHMATQSPDDRAPFLARCAQRVNDRPERIARQNMRQRIEPARDAGTGTVDRSETGSLHFAAAFLEADGLEARKVQWRLRIFAHANNLLSPWLTHSCVQRRDSSRRSFARHAGVRAPLTAQAPPPSHCPTLSAAPPPYSSSSTAPPAPAYRRQPRGLRTRRRPDPGR